MVWGSFKKWWEKCTRNQLALNFFVVSCIYTFPHLCSNACMPSGIKFCFCFSIHLLIAIMIASLSQQPYQTTQIVAMATCVVCALIAMGFYYIEIPSLLFSLLIDRPSYIKVCVRQWQQQKFDAERRNWGGTAGGGGGFTPTTVPLLSWPLLMTDWLQVTGWWISK